MTRLKWAAAVVVLVPVLAALRHSAAEEGNAPSVKEIMTKAHKGGNSLLAGIRKELQAGDPDWDDVHKKTTELVKLGTSMTRAQPTKGGKESWDTLTKGYLGFTKELDSAADKKDKDASLGALKKIGGSCKACHNAHKGK